MAACLGCAWEKARPNRPTEAWTHSTPTLHHWFTKKDAMAQKAVGISGRIGMRAQVSQLRDSIRHKGAKHTTSHEQVNSIGATSQFSLVGPEGQEGTERQGLRILKM